MKLHAATHDQKEYKCSSCLKTFNSQPNLNQHTRGMHGPGWTALCGSNFQWPKEMHRHEDHCMVCASIHKKNQKARKKIEKLIAKKQHKK